MRVLIIGAGPIGCYTARLLKEKSQDYEVEIIEEHSEIGKPVHCAGLVSKAVLSEIKLSLSDNFIINYIDGAEFFLNANSFKIERKDVALVIDREKFDRALGEGLDVNFNTKFMGIEKEQEGYLIETDRREYYADVVIGADGANSSLRKMAGFEERIEYLRGVQFRLRIDESNNNKNMVAVYIKNKFFAWFIPENEEIARVGTISYRPYHDLMQLLNGMEIKGEILEKFGGIVPLGTCQTQKENLYLVGDAACQVKPLTHGGIYYGMRCTEILVDCILENRPNEYEKEWRRRFEREINIGLRLRHIYERLSEDDIKKIFLILKDNAKLIESYADFENHSKVISILIKNPNLQILLGKLLINIFEYI